MKIAITGCNGMVGQRVVLRALQTSHTVVGIDNVAKEGTEFRHDPHFIFILADLTHFEETLKAFEGCDAIVQLAAINQPIDYKVNTHNRNVVISWNVLRAAAELGIHRVAQASSVNVLRGVYSVQPQFDYFPIDERHPTLPDEPYGLSKLIAEMQADTIVRRYPRMRVASLRLHWSIPTRARAYRKDNEKAKGDLWGYVQEDSSAEAFLRAVTEENDEWKGHETFFIAAPQVAADEDSLELKQKYFPDVTVREGWVKSGRRGFFDCSKAERFFGWVHRDYA
ncbi:hypothetical protein L210DRAFT_3401371 [Boletus edulis BED1]|uniref:NAD-dependent epimerase/dehydratase domain-containing protein n=1 Tax=Boletus edulis BED1 TaxID=1328754 RepID=A0AAD4GER7_BOLED|nr:hypothetical protein L210DRAFT_3401371 [Boletus edulis BED1]